MLDTFLDQEAAADDAALSERALSKLRWRCRRGLLENDLFIESFFAHHAADLTYAQARALMVLMDLGDNDLLDLLLQRKEPEQSDMSDEQIRDVRNVLAMLRAGRSRVPN
jgi:antitoxin CptB